MSRAAIVAVLASLTVTVAPLAAAGPPHRVVTVDPQRHTIDGIVLGAEAMRFVQRWGDPGMVAQIGSSRRSWYTWVGADGMWASVIFSDVLQRHSTWIAFRGPYVTTRGDRPGTPLAAFRRHWPGARVVGRAVAVDGVTFRLDSARRLADVQLGRPPYCGLGTRVFSC